MVQFKDDIFAKPKYEEDLLRIKFSKGKDNTRILLKLLRKANRKLKAKNKFNHNYTTNNLKYSYLKPIDKRQLCVIKFRYGKHFGGHKNFLKTYMPQHNKEEVLEKPEYFGDELASYEANMTKKHFKFIISPDNQNIDLKVLTKTLVRNMNEILGYDLRWIATEHNDTEHKHVHLLINGKDKNGRYINKIPKDFIKYTMRELAKDICTKIVGERTYQEINAYKRNTYKTNRITDYDKIIVKEAQNNYEKNSIKYPSKIKARNDIYRKRLDHLISLGIAKKEKDIYFLEKDWYDTLKATGRYNTFLDAKKEYAYKNKPFKLYNNENIKGKILKIYNMNDENIWNNGAVIECENSIYYVVRYEKFKRDFLNKKVEVTPEKKAKGLKSINVQEIR